MISATEDATVLENDLVTPLGDAGRRPSGSDRQPMPYSLRSAGPGERQPGMERQRLEARRQGIIQRVDDLRQDCGHRLLERVLEEPLLGERQLVAVHPAGHVRRDDAQLEREPRTGAGGGARRRRRAEGLGGLGTSGRSSRLLHARPRRRGSRTGMARVGRVPRFAVIHGAAKGHPARGPRSSPKR